MCIQTKASLMIMQNKKTKDGVEHSSYGAPLTLTVFSLPFKSTLVLQKTKEPRRFKKTNIPMYIFLGGQVYSITFITL